MMTLQFLRILAIADVLWLIFWIWWMMQAPPQSKVQDAIVVWLILPGILVLVGVLTCGFFIQ